MNHTDRISISIDPDDKEKVKILAKKNKRTMAGYVRWLIKKELQEQEAIDE